MADKVPAAAGNGPMLVKPATWEALRQRVDDLEIIPDPKDFDISRRGGKQFIRLRGLPGAVRPGPPPIPAFTLSAGKSGARIYKGWLEWTVTTLKFKRRTIKMQPSGGSVDEVNLFTGQDEISGIMPLIAELDEAGEAEPPPPAAAEDWLELSWWGDVWAQWTVNEKTGHPTDFTIVGPDKPDLRAISALNEDLVRDGGSGSGASGGETGYCLRIGNVPEAGAIEQERTGNIHWAFTFIPESEGIGLSGSSRNSSAGSSDGGGSTSGSSKDTAIVPTPDGYRKWYAMESAEVLFFDFGELNVFYGLSHHDIDPLVAYCCEAGSLRAFVSPERGSATVRVVSDVLILRAHHFPWPRRQRVQVMLCGVRRGFAGIRLGFAEFEDFVDNECRLNPRLERSDILQQLENRGIVS
jgi:hypothetical protein